MSQIRWPVLGTAPPSIEGASFSASTHALDFVFDLKEQSLIELLLLDHGFVSSSWSAEDSFYSLRIFFSRNLQYMYLKFLSAEFSPKKHVFVVQIA